MKKRFAALALATLMMVFCLAGYSHAVAEVTNEQVDNVVIVLPQSSFDLSPFNYGNRIFPMFYHELYGTLMVSPYFGAPLDELEYRIAKNVLKVSDTVYDVEIYDYVYDSQGNDITAEDVVYSYEVAKSTGRYTALGSYMESIAALDEYTVQITLSNAIPGAIEQILNRVSIVDSGWYENASEAERGQNPATTGPYAVESSTTGTGFVIVARDDYWQTDESLRSMLDKQTSKRMTYTAITEMAMVSIALENGEVDIAEIDATVIDNFVNDDGTAKDGYNAHYHSVPRFNVLEYNCSDDSPMSNQYLRQAVSYALDAEQIMLACGVPLSMGTVSHDFTNSVGAGYNAAWDEEDYYDYNLEKAKECFELSGYSEGLELHILHSIGAAANWPIAVQAQLAQIGINVVIDAVEQALYDTMVLESDKWDMATRLVSTSDFVTSGWAARFDENIYGEQGTGNFVKDDKLQTLLHTAMETQSAEDIDAFHYYLKDMCYSYGLYTANKCLISQDGILTQGGTYEGNPNYNAVEYAQGYVSSAN